MIAALLAVLRHALPYLLVAAALASASWWLYERGDTAGAARVQAEWDAERRTAEEARTREVAEASRRLDRLNGEIETLRARPERVRTVLETIHVPADDQCSSAPAELRRLWDAEPAEPGDHAPAEPAALRDAGLPVVATDGR